MKNKSSLFLKATAKYTSMSQDLLEAKKLFLETAVSPTATAADLNKLYQPKDVKSTTEVESSLSKDTSSNPNGTAVKSNTAPTEIEALASLTSFADPAQKPITLPNGDLLFIDPVTGSMTVSSADPSKVSVRSTDNVKQIQDLAKTAKSVLSQVTNEDIMSALTTLSTGDVVSAEPNKNMEADDESIVGPVSPVSDTLVDESDDDMSSSEETTDESSVENSDVVNATSSSIMPPSSPASTLKNASVDVSYANNAGGLGEDSDEPKESGETDEQGEETSDGPKDKEGSEDGNAFGDDTTGSKPEVPEQANSLKAEPEEAVESNPSGKESAFWVPNDDLLGLKDIISSVGKDSGVPNSQERIVKDDAGNLVKKPTTNTHQIPNMRQYVKTNSAPGVPGVPPGMYQAVDLADLDSVVGMDPSSDKALNISLNFNF